MYTQCPECATVFRVTADALRAAQGTVRCGICASSFNAIEYLNEQPIPRRGDEPPFEDTITVEEVHGTEFIELSGVERQAEDPGTAADEGGAELEETGDADLEFHGSAQDLERLFVTVDSGPDGPAPAAGSATGDAPLIGSEAELAETILRIAENEFSGIEVSEERFPEGFDPADTNPGRIAAVLAFPPPGLRQPDTADVEPSAEADAAPEGDGDAQAAGGDQDEGDQGAEVRDLDRTDEYPLLVPEGGDEEAQGLPAAADEVPDGVAAQPSSPAEDETLLVRIPEELRRSHATSAESAFDGTVEPSPASRRWPWLLAAGVLVLALTVQAVHFWRQDLARNPVVGPWLMRAYGALGLPLAPPADLSAFEVRQLGAASDALQAGRIKLRASIVNRADFAQPLPLLRLSLQDRFGSTIGTRDLEPAEYLPGGVTPASGLLGPDQRADAQVVFVDPGRDAVGFELDVCLREAGTVRCSTSSKASR